MAFLTQTSTPRRVRRVGRAALAGLAAATVSTLVAVGPAREAGAQNVELAINELAPEIAASADRAVAALDAYSASGSADDLQLLAYHRDITARYVATQLGYDEFAMIDAWSQAGISHQRAVLGALTQVGVPYRSHASEEGVGFDCSGMTSYAWAGAGIDLFRRSSDQIRDSRSITRETAKPGDLVYYPGHVMMYLGVEDAIVHAIQTGRTVEVDTISARRRDSVRWGDPTG